jgi:hypothetical protein
VLGISTQKHASWDQSIQPNVIFAQKGILRIGHFGRGAKYRKVQTLLHPAVMAQWLAHPTGNSKVAGSMPTTAMSSLGHWLTQP